MLRRRRHPQAQAPGAAKGKQEAHEAAGPGGGAAGGLHGRAADRLGMRGLYVHVPFCEKRCHYCDFNTYLLREGGVDQYLEALAQEAALYAARDDVAGVEFDTLYIGGGTPTALGPAPLERPFAALAPLGARPGAEGAADGHPGTDTGARPAVWRARGV